MVSTPISANDFLLSEGGPFYRIMVKMRLDNRQGKLAIAALCVTWVPLVIITVIEGTFYNNTQLSFLADIAFQARVLVALQMLILMQVAVDNRVSAVIQYISGSLLDADERKTSFADLLQQAKKLTNSGIAEIILLVIVGLSTAGLVNGGVYSALRDGTTSWMTSPYPGYRLLSVAGYWAVFISIPVFQFLLFRWLWRYLVWMLLLFRLSRIRLNLLPTHADRAGGLGILILAQKSFCLIFLVGSVVLSGQFMVLLSKHVESFITIRNEVIAYVLISIVFLLLPLLFFTSKLTIMKYNGLQHLGILGATLSQKFEREWMADLPIEKRLENSQPDPSLLFDYAGMYDQLQHLRTIPATLRDVIGFAIVLLAPFIPILFIHFSVAELLQRVGGMLT